MSELRIVQGNNFGTAISIEAVDATGHAIQDFSLEGSTDIRVWYVYGGKEVEIDGWTIQDGKILILWPKDLRFGTYDLFQSGMYGETSWRNAMRAQFTIVKYNYEANIPDDVIVLDGIYQLSAQMAIITQISGGGGIPSDADPLMDGTASPGIDTKYSRGDHRHPSDTSKQDKIDVSHKLSADLVDDGSTTNKFVTAVEKMTWNNKSDFSGSYNDLTDKPTIPAAQVNSDWNANSGVAQILNKPTIPSVVDSLSSGSTTAALSANQGKVLNESKQATIDSSHKLSADLVDDASTTNKFVTSSEKSTWNGKQDAISDLATIRSGAALGATSVQSVKTINGNTMTGTGNVSTMTPVTNHGTSDTTYAVTPNALHVWGTVGSLTLTLATPTDATIVNEYMIEFTSGSTATTLSLPSSVEWAESCGALSVEASKTYQISIVNNIGLWASISNS